MDLILDTSVLVDAERGRATLAELVGDDEPVAIAAITLAELLHGVEIASGRIRQRRTRFVEAVAAQVPVITYDRHVAVAHARLLAEVQRSGRPRGAHDLIIAATAAATARTVVTADLQGFTDLPGVRVRGGTSDAR